MKKALSILLTIVMLVSIIPAIPLTASAADVSGQCGENATFTIAGNTLTISGTGAMYDYLMNPAEWFSYRDQITAIVVEEGITSIGIEAFSSLYVQSVSIADSVTEIGASAFIGCDPLTTVTIGSGVTVIQNAAFQYCTALENVYYTGTQETWDAIEIGTVNECLTKHIPIIIRGACGDNAGFVYNPDTGVLTISGTGAMYDYPMELPAWFHYKELGDIVIEEGITYIGIDAFSCLKTVRSVSIADSVTEISASAFNDCPALNTLTIGSGVRTIGNCAFQECNILRTVEYTGTDDAWDEIEIGTHNEGLTRIMPQSSSGTCGENAVYRFNPRTRVLTISGTGAMYDYPMELPEYSDYKDGISTVVVKDGITTIGGEAFWGFEYLRSVEIADSVTNIGYDAFRECPDLETITIGSGVSVIQNCAFQDCTALKEVRYTGTQETWDAIEIGTHNECLTKLRPIIIRGACGDNAVFAYHPDTGVLTISGTGAMYDYPMECPAWFNYEQLTTIIIEEGITYIGIDAFSCLKTVQSVSIADSVTEIGYSSFYDCPALATLTIGSGVSVIQNCAFQDCTALEEVKYTGSDDAWDDIEIGTYNECLTNLKPQSESGACGENAVYRYNPRTGVLTIYGSGNMDDFTSTNMPWYNDKADIKAVVVENGITGIGENAFWQFKNIESVTLGDTLESIGKYAFSGCEKIESIDLPNSLTSIGGQAFGNCVILESIVIPSGVTSLATSTFASCTALTTVTLPTTLTKIGAAAFFRCYNLQTVNYAGTQDDWNAVEILDSNDPLLAVKPQTIDIIRTGMCGENVSYILNETTGLLTISGTGAMYDYDMMENPSPFNNNPKIKEIVVESGVSTIGNDAFTQLRNLKTVSLPGTVTSLGDDAFSFCFALSDINILESVQSIGSSAFSACYALTSFTVPKGVKTLGKSTFWYCDHLQSVALPKSLERVSDNAFVYCTALTDVYYEGSEIEWSDVTLSTTGNDPLLAATMHYDVSNFAAVRYRVPILSGVNTLLTLKSDRQTLEIPAENGRFSKDNVESGVYRVYAKQKNCLSVCLGEYDTASGAVINTNVIALPLGDVNEDDVIDFADISSLLSSANYGKDNREIDLTGDGMITVEDISTTLLAGNYGMQSVKIA
ncbi:MAG: leucine-rich repeat protein [Clostridia bacterium]|nr:leucine-rich repeat protein [Clostridia bacterium]